MPTDPAKDFDRELTLLLENLDRAYDRASWHGPNLRGSFRGVDAAQASWRPSPGRHSVAEQVLHAAYWKYTVRRRLTGEKRGSFPIKGSNWFDVPDPLAEPDWRGHIELLEIEHRALREAIAALDPARLGESPAGTKGQGQGQGPSRSSVRATVLGVAAHDVYHAGQIQLLRRLMAEPGRTR
jgi:uncharacterized damage-inducible protein DinB